MKKKERGEEKEEEEEEEENTEGRSGMRFEKEYLFHYYTLAVP